VQTTSSASESKAPTESASSSLASSASDAKTSTDKSAAQQTPEAKGADEDHGKEKLAGPLGKEEAEADRAAKELFGEGHHR
jgi:hypothetical protein